MIYRICALALSFFSVCAVDEVPLAIPKGVMVSSGLDASFVATFALFVAFVLFWTIAVGKILKIFTHSPVIAGQIIGGVLLGPSGIDVANFKIFSKPMNMIDNVTGSVYSLASSDLYIFFILLISAALTVSYLMWIAGHETDVRDILKVGVTAVSAGVLGALLPIGVTYLIALFLFSDLFSVVQAIGMGIIFSATSVSIPVAMLFSQHKMHLKSSKATLGAAIIDDIVAVILLSMFFIALQSGMFGIIAGYVSPAHGVSLWEAIVYMLLSFAIIFLVGYYFIPTFVRKLKHYKSSHLIASAANSTMLLYFAFAELVGGLAGITGAYFAGLFHRMGDDRHQAERVISPFVNAVLLPLFLGSIGLQIDIRVLSMYDWGIVAVMLIGAILSKMIGCYIAAELSNFSKRRKSHRWSMLDTYLFGSSMVARGEVGLVISTILRAARVIDAEQYVIAVVVIVLTTIAAPMMLSIGFAILDRMPQDDEDDYEVNIGFFKAIGTMQLFNAILGLIEAAGVYKTTFRFSEGRKIINIEGQNVKIIMSPEEGIILKGNRQKIGDILKLVKKSIGSEIEHIPVS